MAALLRTLKTILKHPLSSLDRRAALARYLKWQIGSRLVPGPVLVPLIGHASLIVSPGMTGATQNIYNGLSDFSDCALLLHLLRKEDLFVDIGANVGVYTVLASGVVGASSIAIEPVPSTFTRLCANLQVNDIVSRAIAHNVGLSREAGTLRFTSDRDTANHVAPENWSGPTIAVPVATLDEVLNGRGPTLIKIDVEGWESQVFAGAKSTLDSSPLLALIVEMDSTTATMNDNDDAVDRTLRHHGFATYSYDPFTRSLTMLPGKNRVSANTLYLRNPERVQAILSAAPVFEVNGRSF